MCFFILFILFSNSTRRCRRRRRRRKRPSHALWISSASMAWTLAHCTPRLLSRRKGCNRSIFTYELRGRSIVALVIGIASSQSSDDLMTAEEENGATPAAGMPTGAGRVARPPAAIGVIGDGRATAARSMCSLWKDRSIAGGWGQQEGRAYRQPVCLVVYDRGL